MSNLLRVGRGGAGNFFSQKDVEEAAKAQQANEDLEAQKAEVEPAPENTAPQAPPQYVRSGRGGAGNFAEPPTGTEAQDRQDVVHSTTAAVAASLAGKPKTGLTGRGGAGNWADSAAPAAEGDAEGTHAKQQQIEDQVVHDIEASLPPPPKTYHQHDRDME